MIFSTLIKVRFGDIDTAGIVYYPRFVHYFHIALEDFFDNQLGIRYSQVINKYKIGLPTVHLEADFHHRLLFGDIILLEVNILKIGTTSIKWGYDGYLFNKKKNKIIEGNNTTVCIDIKSFKKKPIPLLLRKKIESYQQQYPKNI